MSKSNCPFFVRPAGMVGSVPYCPGRRGGTKAHIAAGCHVDAARADDGYREQERLAEAGTLGVVAAWGSWHRDAAPGTVIVATTPGGLRNGEHRHRYFVMRRACSSWTRRRTPRPPSRNPARAATR